jgi:hypothetical protein
MRRRRRAVLPAQQRRRLQGGVALQRTNLQCHLHLSPAGRAGRRGVDRLSAMARTVVTAVAVLLVLSSGAADGAAPATAGNEAPAAGGGEGTPVPLQSTGVDDLSGWLTAGALWTLVVDPVVRPAKGARPTSVDATTSGPGFFLGFLPGRGRIAGGVLLTYRPSTRFGGGRVGLWYLDLQGHYLPVLRAPVSVFAALHAGSLSWTSDASPAYSDSEFTAGFGLGMRYAPLRHLSLVGEYRATGLFHGADSMTCINGACSESSEDQSKFMHVFSLGVAFSCF